jgi:hypothetical protein
MMDVVAVAVYGGVGFGGQYWVHTVILLPLFGKHAGYLPQQRIGGSYWMIPRDTYIHIHDVNRPLTIRILKRWGEEECHHTPRAPVRVTGEVKSLTDANNAAGNWHFSGGHTLEGSVLVCNTNMEIQKINNTVIYCWHTIMIIINHE